MSCCPSCSLFLLFQKRLYCISHVSKRYRDFHIQPVLQINDFNHTRIIWPSVRDDLLGGCYCDSYKKTKKEFDWYTQHVPNREYALIRYIMDSSREIHSPVVLHYFQPKHLNDYD